MQIIREELEEVKFAWNNHSIRKQKSGDIVPGIPELLYHVPEMLGQFTCFDSFTKLSNLGSHIFFAESKNKFVFESSLDSIFYM